MIVRSIGVLVFVGGAAALVGALAILGRAPGLPLTTRHLRAMKDRVEAPADVRAFTMDDMAALPHGAPLADRARLETRGVRVEGTVQRMVLSADGDLHLELTPSPRRLGDPDTTYVVAEITPPWRERTPAWGYESLLVAFRPNRGGRAPWEAGPRRVRLTGWLLYDQPYDRPVSTWLRRHGAPRRTGWEVHPVTGIELWDGSAGTWRELAR